ncbi:MAG: type II toxin-antitoxin system HicB family antitoxin [SAR324 cluster bacterium]
MKPLEYAIVIEKSHNGYGAYAPDLPGCAAVGRTKRETVTLLRQAIALHLRGRVEDGDPIPEPSTTAGSVRVALAGRGRRTAAI